jgi:UDP-glucose 4-epimerase
MTSVLVTGAGGYIGQRITRRLVATGVPVRALVRTPVQWPAGVDEVVGDLALNPDLARTAGGDVDTVIHLAGTNEADSADDPAQALAATVLAAERVAECGASRIIYLSTIHVYGDALAPGALVSEETPPAPRQPYAAARLACEEVFASCGLPTLVFRLTNGVGAPSRPEIRRWSLVANQLCREGAVTGRLTLRSPGVQWRDFIALEDVESGLAAMVSAESFVAGTYNFGSGHSVTIRDLAGIIQQSFVGLGEPEPALVAPRVPAEVPGPYTVDITRLRQLGVAVGTPLRRAVDETVRFCLDHRAALR